MIAPSIDNMERAWDEAKYGRPSSQPFSQMFIQSATDPTLAPEESHTLSMWGHRFPYRLSQGDIDTERTLLRDRMIDLMTDYAPNIRQSVLACEVFPARYSRGDPSQESAGTAFQLPVSTCAEPARILAAT